jgi:hypothetical protein
LFFFRKNNFLLNIFFLVEGDDEKYCSSENSQMSFNPNQKIACPFNSGSGRKKRFVS